VAPRAEVKALCADASAGNAVVGTSTPYHHQTALSSSEKMRVCIVTVAGHGIGGMQDHTRALAKGLSEAGHEVDVVTTRHPQSVVDEERDYARWHYVDAAHHHPRLPRRDPAWLSRSRETFLHLHRECPFDVIHSESTSAIGLVRQGIHREVPLVAKFHGNGIAFTRAALRRFQSNGVAAKVHAAKGLVWLFAEWFQYGHWYRFRPCVWMVPSRQEFEETRRSCFLQRGLGHVVPNGIDTRIFTPRPREETRAELGLGDVPLFVCAGRLDPDKGTHHAIRALTLLADRGYPAKLAVVGSGPDREKLEALAQGLGLARSVVFTGPQPHDVLARYLAAADAFLFPTQLNEAAPLAPLQALACGTPVIASSVGSVPELIESPGDNGLLVRPGDPEALAAAMRRVLDDATLRRRLSLGGLERVRAEYTLEQMVERTLAVYKTARERLATSH
jgi:glycosyltransferase involved in cell wall biosynthesis